MTATQEYAVLSLYVYDVRNRLDNRPLLPTGWEELKLNKDDLLSFSYGVFRRIGTTEIVIAYAGTNEIVGDWAINVIGGIGLVPAPQITSAAKAYLDAKATYGSNITLSGHSLGGAREAQVTSYYVKGEVLNQWLGLLPFVVGSNCLIDIGGGDQLPAIGGPLTLHSIVLHSALLISKQLRKDTLVLPDLLARIFDTHLYAFKLERNDKDFLTKLLKAESADGDISTGMLSSFATDMQKLGTNYQFRSCLRPSLFGKSTIRYPKTAAHARDVCLLASHTSVRGDLKNTIHSIAACARKKGASRMFDSKNQTQKRQKQTFLTSEASS